MKRKLCLLLMLLCLSLGCTRSPVQEVHWTDHTGQPAEKDSSLVSGIDWRALIWNEELYYLGPLNSLNLASIHKVSPKKKQGLIFKPIPKELECFTTLALVPGPNDQMGWFYRTPKEEAVGAVFGPEGWIVEPQLVWEEEEDSEGYSAVSGAAWVDGKLEAILFRGYSHRPFDSDGLTLVSLDPGQKNFATQLIPWRDLVDQAAPPANSSLVGSHRFDTGWRSIFSSPHQETSRLWYPGEDKKPQFVDVSLPPNAHHMLWDTTDRTPVNSLGFSVDYYQKSSTQLYRWDPPYQFSLFDMELPESATAWGGLYRATGPNKLSFVPCYFDGSGIFQKQDGRSMTLERRDGKTVLRTDQGPPQILFENQDFPNGSNDFVFIPSDKGVFAVEFGGRFINIDPTLARSSDPET